MEHGEIDLGRMMHQLRRRSGDLHENFVRLTWQQMLEAVHVIHEERIVHSDLKPANFLFVRGSLKLIDFGIAKAISNDTTNIMRDSQVRAAARRSADRAAANPISRAATALATPSRATDVAAGMQVGTLNYMSPEALQDTSSGDHDESGRPCLKVRAQQRCRLCAPLPNHDRHAAGPRKRHLVPGLHPVPDGVRQVAVRGHASHPEAASHCGPTSQD